MKILVAIIFLIGIGECKETALSFLKLGVGPKALGMGGAFSAIGDDPSAFYWNPAGMLYISTPEILLSHTELILGIKRESAFYLQPTRNAAFGLAIDHLWTNGIEKRGQPTDTKEGEFSVSDSLIGIGYTRRINENLDIGLSGKFIQESLDDEKNRAISIDIGTLYKREKIRMALCIKELGTKISHYNLPLNIKTGIAYLPKENLILSLDIDNYIFDKERNIRLGGEANLLKNISLRLGYILSPGNRKDWSVGLGLNSRYRFDYVYIPHNEIGGFQYFSFLAPIKGWSGIRLPGRNKEPLNLGYDLSLNDIFPSKYKYYTFSPIGSITLKNNKKRDISKVKVSLSIPKYMSYPTNYDIEKIPPSSTKDIPLYASFNDEQILARDEDTTMQAKIDISYVSGGKEFSDSITKPIILFNKNLIDWREKENISAFVTPNDTQIKLFTRRTIGVKNEDMIGLEKSLLHAIEIFSGLSLYPISYISDTSKQAFGKDISLDTIQYPRETLNFTKGDCDDLSVLYASCLESIGIPTAFIDLSSHILLMFDTGIRKNQENLLSFDPSSYIVKGDHLWIPIEPTYLDKSFVDAWNKGIEEYKKEKDVEVIETASCWRFYPSVALPPSDWTPKIPESPVLEERVAKEIEKLRSYQKEVAEKRIKEYQERIKSNPNDISSLNYLGIIYAKDREYDLAYSCFEMANKINQDYPSPYNNLANLYFLNGSPTSALNNYKEAIAKTPGDSGVYFNMGLLYYIEGKEELAEKMFNHSLILSPNFDLAYNLSQETTKANKPNLSLSEIKRLLKEARKKIPEPDGSSPPHKPTPTQAMVSRMEEIFEPLSERLLIAILNWRE